MTDLAQGAAFFTDERLRCPDSARFSRYFISPAWPASIHCEKTPSSGKSSSRTGATPTRSNPASAAVCLAVRAISSLEITVHIIADEPWDERKTARHPIKGLPARHRRVNRRDLALSLLKQKI